MASRSSTTDLALVDTNVLVYAVDELSPHRLDCVRLLKRARAGELRLCATPQIAAEFYAVVTSRRHVLAIRSPDEAADALRRLFATAGITTLPIPSDVVGDWLELARRHDIRDRGVFDAQIAATMLAHSVDTIYTYNERDFSRFDGITVLAP